MKDGFALVGLLVAVAGGCLAGPANASTASGSGAGAALPASQQSGHSHELDRGRLFRTGSDVPMSGAAVQIYVRSDPWRPKLEDDLKEALARIHGVRVVADAVAGTHVIEIRETQFDERPMVPSIRPQTLDYSELEGHARVSVPKGAAVLFDVEEGGFDLHYAFDIIITKDGSEVATRTVQNVRSKTYRSCSNMRYQNVFGGVGGMDTYPNGEISVLCTSSSHRPSVPEVGPAIAQELVFKIQRMIPGLSPSERIWPPP